MPKESLYSQNFKNIDEAKISSNILQDCASAATRLRRELSENKLAPINVIFATEDLKQFARLAEKIAPYKRIMILGVGGSSLGGKTIAALRDQTKVEFLESIDPKTIKNSLDKLDLRETFFLVISKSGETIETICQTLIIIEKFEKTEIQNFAQQFLFVTQNQESPIYKIAHEIGAEITEHSREIGGRYSGFSVVGMLPAILCGINAEKIRHGAQKIVNDFMQNDHLTNSCAIQLDLYQQGFRNNVIMPYIDVLKNFTDWYRQLWAESLGKSGFGSTPINSMGTVDQHSQLQLYLEGPQDKFFTFVTLENHQDDFLVKDLPACPTLFGGKKLSDIVKIEQETTIEVLNQKKLPIRIFAVKKLDEEVLGGLMMQCFLETILVAYAKNINPFDQPAVELRKDLARTMLKQHA